MMREVEEVTHKLKLSKEGAEPIELDLHGHKHGTDHISFPFPIDLL
jgi:hypothetical protein